MNADALTPPKFLRVSDLARRRGHARSTAYRYVEHGLLTPAIRLGPGCAVWPVAEVDAIDQARIAGANDDEIRRLVAELIAARKQKAAA